MTRTANLFLIAAILLCVEIPPLGGTAAAATVSLLTTMQPQLEALLPQDVSGLSQILLLAFVALSVLPAGRNAAYKHRLGNMAICTVLASGVWTAGDLPIAIAWSELPVFHWVSLLVETAAAK